MDFSIASYFGRLIAFFGGGALSGKSSAGIIGIWLAVVVGFAWLTAMSVHLYRMAPNPNCAPE